MTSKEIYTGIGVFVAVVALVKLSQRFRESSDEDITLAAATERAAELESEATRGRINPADHFEEYQRLTQIIKK